MDDRRPDLNRTARFRWGSLAKYLFHLRAGARRAPRAAIFLSLALSLGCQSLKQSEESPDSPKEKPPFGGAANPNAVQKEPAKTKFQSLVEKIPLLPKPQPDASVENIVRGPDGSWRVDARQASLEEKKKSGFTAAEQLFREEKYSKAATAFKRVAKKHKETPLEEEALFMRAESLYKANKLPGAQDAYAALLTKYPTTRYLPQSIQRSYDIAYYWLEDSQLRSQGKPGKYNRLTSFVNLFDPTRPILDTNGRAIETIDSIQQYDPFGPLTDDAVMMGGAYKFTNGNFVQAAGYYEQVVNDQPKSEHATRALVLGSQAYLRAYQGPQYDGSELEGAQRLTKAALSRSSDLSAEQRVRLEQDLRIIYLERAKREFAVGEQYRRMRRPAAAKFYFEKVARNYSDTDWARRAEEEIKKIDAQLAAKKAPMWTDVKEKITALLSRPPAPPPEEEKESDENSDDKEKKPKRAVKPPPAEIPFERDNPGQPRSAVDPR